MNRSTQPSPEALASLHDSAYRWALACCGFDEDRAREALQMTYVEILGGSAVFDGRSALKTWLFAVVRRSAWRVEHTLRRADLLRARLQALTPFQADGDDVSHGHLARGEAGAAVREALSALSPRQRQLIDLVYYHDLSVTEAARVMGIGVGSARQHFHRAKRTLAASLAPRQEAFSDV